MVGIPKLTGHILVLSFFALIFLTSTFATQIQLAYAIHEDSSCPSCPEYDGLPGTGSRSVQDFCSALRRGDLEDAEDLVGLLGGGTISSLAKVLCRLVQ